MTKKTQTSSVVATPTKPEEDSGRQVIQDVILHVIRDSFKGSATLDQIEATCQKIDPKGKDRYKDVAKSEFEMKDGKVLPKISERGLKIAVRYTASRNTPHWGVRNFPEEAKTVAAKLGVTLPALASKSIFTEEGVEVKKDGCPKCNSSASNFPKRSG